jgi:hypothetical protein
MAAKQPAINKFTKAVNDHRVNLHNMCLARGVDLQVYIFWSDKSAEFPISRV